MEHIVLKSIVEAFYALLGGHVLPFLSYESKRTYANESVLFRTIDEIDRISDDDVVCTCEIDKLLEICLLTDGSVLINGNCPLSNLCCWDWPPYIKEGEWLKTAVRIENSGYEYLYRISQADLVRYQIIESLNTYLTYYTASFPFLQVADAKQLELDIAA